MPFTGNLLQVFCIIIFWPLFVELPYSRRNTLFHRDAATIKRYVTVHSSVVECCGDVWGSIFKHAKFLFRHRHMKENLAPRSTVRCPCNCRFRVLSCLFLAIKFVKWLSADWFWLLQVYFFTLLLLGIMQVNSDAWRLVEPFMCHDRSTQQLYCCRASIWCSSRSSLSQKQAAQSCDCKCSLSVVLVWCTQELPVLAT